MGEFRRRVERDAGSEEGGKDYFLWLIVKNRNAPLW